MATSNSGNDFLRNFKIPEYVLVPEPESEKKDHDHVPECPVLVFINSRSGGQLGGNLLITYRQLLNCCQRLLIRDLETLKRNGDEFATTIQEKLRIIVAGGDGTAGWFLGVVSDLKLAHSPPIATVPLGTGNNLPFAFGWGKKNPGTDFQAVETFLRQVKGAKEMKIDSWHILMRMKIPQGGSCGPIPPLDLPHSLHVVASVSDPNQLNMEGFHTFRGGFWNYFSIGMDAEVSYKFHSERKLNPEKFKNQFVNQTTYAKLGFSSSYSSHNSTRNIAQFAKVMIIKNQGDHWEELIIPNSIRSIVCLNLPSFSGGFNPWGEPSRIRRRNAQFTSPFVDDGHIEVVGFTSARHGLILLAPKGHGTRLAQAHRIKFLFFKGGTDQTYMRIDGEPWMQPLPVADDSALVEISHLGQVNILSTDDCRSKSMYNPLTPKAHDNEETDSEEENVEEEFRKFGAADTFKISEEIDITRLS